MAHHYLDDDWGYLPPDPRPLAKAFEAECESSDGVKCAECGRSVHVVRCDQCQAVERGCDAILRGGE